MHINSISIVPQDVGCNAKCKYCIAAMTCNARMDMKKPGINLPKLEKCLKYAKNGDASTAIITSSERPYLGAGPTLRTSYGSANSILAKLIYIPMLRRS